MARQLVKISMKGQTDVAVLASGNPATLAALNHRCPATTVLEKNSLFITLQGLTHFLQQQR